VRLSCQVARFANAKETKNARYLDITTVYDGAALKGQRVLVTGAEQGLGLETVKELVAQGAFAIACGRTSSPDLDAFAATAPDKCQIIVGVDVTKVRECPLLDAQGFGRCSQACCYRGAL